MFFKDESTANLQPIGYCNWKMEQVTQVQILEEAVCISLYADALGKGMNWSILSPIMCKIFWRSACKFDNAPLVGKGLRRFVFFTKGDD